jgi:hypothetical protein
MRRPGGIYRETSNMGRLWDLLQDGQWHPRDQVLASLNVKNPHDRLAWLTKHGQENGTPDRTWAKTHHWTVEENGPMIRMLIRPI